MSTEETWKYVRKRVFKYPKSGKMIIVQEMGYTWSKIAGPQFWMYKGKTLYELNQK